MNVFFEIGKKAILHLDIIVEGALQTHCLKYLYFLGPLEKPNCPLGHQVQLIFGLNMVVSAFSSTLSRDGKITESKSGLLKVGEHSHWQLYSSLGC